MPSSLDDHLKQLTSPGNKGILGAVVTIVDADGPLYTRSQGRRAFNAAADEVLAVDAGFWAYSLTKLLTTVAALQCVERGQVQLDDHVESILPELRDMQVITTAENENGFELVPATLMISLRHLLTHTSGIGYDAVNPLLTKWRAARGETPQMMCGDVVRAYMTPQLFEPGSSWAYGGGVDWVGVVIERLTHSTLGNYMAEHIFAPLGMTRSTFHPRDCHWPDLDATTIETALRTPGGQLVPIPPMYKTDPATDAGGIGLFTNLPEFARVLDDLLGDEPKLLQSATRDAMFVPQFSVRGPQAEGMNKMADFHENLTGSRDTYGKIAFGFGGLVAVEATPNLPRGTLSWGGLPNLCWGLNRSDRMGSALALQMMPPNDPVCTTLIGALAKEAWASGSGSDGH